MFNWSQIKEGKIIDKNGQIVDRGQIGEVCTRGYLIFQGYWNEPEKTAEVIDRAGWYHTGDLGYLTEEGALVITGRSKEMIIRGGENIYPKEVEEVLLEIDQIIDAHVVGLPDERVGEEVVAFIKIQVSHAYKCKSLICLCWISYEAWNAFQQEEF